MIHDTSLAQFLEKILSLRWNFPKLLSQFWTLLMHITIPSTAVIILYVFYLISTQDCRRIEEEVFLRRKLCCRFCKSFQNNC